LEESKDKSTIREMFDRYRTIVYVGIVVIVSLAIFSLLYFTGRGPTYESLYEGLSDSDSIDVQNYLSQKGIDYTTEEGGSLISIDGDTALVKAELAKRGIPSSTEPTGLAKFEQMSIGSTKFDKEVQYQARLQEDLENGIKKAFDGIDSVSVKVPRIKDKSIFEDEEDDMTISVALGLSTGVELSSDNVEAIQLFVASSIQGISSNDVEVVDNSMNVLSGRTEEDDRAPDNGLKIKDETERKISEELTRVLTSVYGQVKVISRVDINFDEIVQNIEQYDPDGTLVSSEEMSESESQEDETINQEPGANENTEVPGYEITNLDEGDSSYTREKEHLISNFQVGKTVEKIIRHPELRNTNVAVWVDGTLTEEEERNLEEMIAISSGLTGDVEVVENDRLVYENGSVKVVQTEFASSEELDEETEEEGTVVSANEIPIYMWLIIGVLTTLVIILLIAYIRKRNTDENDDIFTEESNEEKEEVQSKRQEVEEKVAILDGEERLPESEDEEEDQYADEEVFEFEWTNERRQLKNLANKAVQKHPDVTASVIKEIISDDEKK